MAENILVNGVSIPAERVLREMQYHPAENADEAMHKAAQTLVIDVLLRQRARERGLVSDDSASVETIIDDLIALEVDIPVASVHECELYFTNNPARFTTSPLVAARHILLAAAPDDFPAREAARQLAQQMIEQLVSEPGRFSALAAEYSRCESAKVGGNLGQLGRGQTVPEFERHVFTAPVGLLKRPLETRYGVHVVHIDHSIPGKPLPFEFVKERIENYLNEKVRRKALAQYLQVLVAQADIQGCRFDVAGSPLMQ